MIEKLLVYFEMGSYPIMVPIFICSVLSIAIILEKLFTLRLGAIVRPRLMDQIKKAISAGQIDTAVKLCVDNENPMTRIVLAGLQAGGVNTGERIHDEGKLEAARLDRYLTTLSTIANISPLLGLLGTVSGMIQVFFTINEQGLGQSQAMAGGISEALITTAFGLIVAIPALAASNYFYAKVEKIITHMEKQASEIAGML